MVVLLDLVWAWRRIMPGCISPAGAWQAPIMSVPGHTEHTIAMQALYVDFQAMYL
jgi:hypothetical protein